jgi:hypothetical protein
MRLNRTIFITGSLILIVTGLLAARFVHENVHERQDMMTTYPADAVSVTVVDPLEKVFQKRAPSNVVIPFADAAAGEVVTFQLVVSAGNDNISNLNAALPVLKIDKKNAGGIKDNISIGYVGYVKVDKNLSVASAGFRTSPDAYYPDPIRKRVSVVQRGNNQPIWISVPVPAGQAPGVYQGDVTISGDAGAQKFSIKQTVTINVLPIKLKKDNGLWISNWWSDGGNVKKFFSSGTNISALIADKMVDYGINSFIISTMNQIDISEKGGRYSFDFTRLDKYIKTFVNAGLNKRIEGGFVGARASSDWKSNYLVLLPVNTNGKTVYQKVELSDPRVDRFYSQYFPSLIAYLKKNGYYDIYYQHIADEPVDDNVSSYNALLRMVKKYAPDMKTLDAIQTDKVSDQLDVWVPVLDVLDKRYASFKKIQESGHELAFYTCWAPQGQYANRLIQMELLKTRYLPWIDFRYSLSGFLHWGFNQWSGDPANKSDNVAGDAWIVYPGDNEILSSIRLDAFRDGVNDYALLTQLKAKNPGKAAQIAARIVKSFSSYELDIPAFRQARKELLSSLAK